MIRHAATDLRRPSAPVGARRRERGSRLRASELAAGVLAAFLMAAPALAAQEADVQLPEGQGTYPTGSLLIQGLDSVWTGAGEVIAGASILIRDGIIEAIGTDLSAPGGVDVLNGAGMTAIPGLVDEHSHTAMAATNEGTGPVVPEVRVLDALESDDFGIYRALSGGVTSARIMHGSSNPIGGQSAVIKMRWGMEEADQLLIDGAPRFVKFALGENVTRKGRGRPGQPTRFPASRQGVEAVYVEAFTAARAYRDAWEAYREDPDAFRVPPRENLRLQALVDIMEGRIRVHAHSYRADEILMLMRVAERFGFTIDVFTHVLEGYKVASEMAEHGAGASTFSDWWQYKLEAYDAIPYNAAIMHRHGVLTAINTDIPWLQSFFAYEMQKPVKYGDVPREEALQMVTLNPARMLGIDDKVGTLEEGKHGDVVLMNGDPFDTFSRVEKTVVDGIVYFDLERERETRDEPFHRLPVVATDAATAAAAATRPQTSAPASTMRADGGPAPSDGDGGASGRSPAAQEEVVAITGATVHPVSGPSIEDGVVVIQGGRIQSVGPASSVQVPAGAREVDASGRHVYPGMIDPITQLGIFEFGNVAQATDTYETGEYNPHVRALAAVDPHGASIPVARSNGITTVLVGQTSGVIQGTGSVIQLRGDTWEQLGLRSDGALIVDFPVPFEPRDDDSWEVFRDEGSVHGAGLASAPEGRPWLQQESPRDDEEPSLDSEELEELVELFERARLYAASPTTADDPTDFFDPNVTPGDAVLLEAMAPALRGELPVFFRADSDWQIRTLFLFLDEFPELDAVILGGTQAFRVADEVARRDLPVILTGAYSPTPDRDDSILASWRNPLILAHAGVTIAFGTDDASDVRNLPYHAAHSVAYGLPPEEGLRAVTLNTARILGMEEEMGSLEPGKRADLIITDGSPLQITTTVESMFIGGVEMDPRDNKHYELYQKFTDRP